MGYKYVTQISNTSILTFSDLGELLMLAGLLHWTVLLRIRTPESGKYILMK